ncbi:hypothetical protein V8G54_010660 [Vigna mungo]|uniref:GRF-type domain-containing protein n=1 Tax=Vigna mungo TaxID=3915 RepID=A0AAQ3P0H3_VIGMU
MISFNDELQGKVKELKAEKNELRDEKNILKKEKEKKSPAAKGQVGTHKLIPFIGYPGIAMWQFMPPAAVDTSKDHLLRPPHIGDFTYPRLADFGAAISGANKLQCQQVLEELDVYDKRSVSNDEGNEDNEEHDCISGSFEKTVGISGVFMETAGEYLAMQLFPKVFVIVGRVLEAELWQCLCLIRSNVCFIFFLQMLGFGVAIELWQCEQVFRTARTPKNKGRRFWGCPKFKGGSEDCSSGCNFFKWCNEDVIHEENVVTVEESGRNNEVGGSLMKMEQMLMKMEERDGEKLKIACLQKTVVSLENWLKLLTGVVVIICLCNVIVISMLMKLG